MKQTVNVTQDDIDQGKSGDPGACPIALAITRDWTGPRSEQEFEVDVQSYNAVVYPGTGGHLGFIASLPRVAEDFVEDFDAGVDRYEPFSFDLDWSAS